jgi:hypothetical protein
VLHHRQPLLQPDSGTAAGNYILTMASANPLETSSEYQIALVQGCGGSKIGMKTVLILKIKSAPMSLPLDRR